ncbi:MAG: hypothetical protein ISS15_21890, partial [Alphaproteobacteria bacterium]|nr:hypothetical protein [Alphaproteobacteria bacterium]
MMTEKFPCCSVNGQRLIVGHVSNVPGTMESCPTFFRARSSPKGVAMLLSLFVACFGLTNSTRCLAADDQPAPKVIRHIDIVHMTHTDIGFTDHPIVCRQQQVRYLDIAIDAVLATCDAPAEAQFYWTAETTLAVDDWWQAADPARRDDLLKA